MAMKKYPKMKPSGVEWMGDVPEGWEVRKVSRSFKMIGSGTTPKVDTDEYYTQGTVSWVLTGDLNDGVLESTSKKISETAFNDHSTLKIYPVGSLVVAMYGATIGKTALLGIPACTNQACCVLAESSFFEIRFVHYWFLSNKQAIINLSYGGGQPNINQEIIKSLKIPCPALPEQTTIAAYLDRKTAQIDQAIAEKEGLIELFREERQAIINHAVTKGIRPGVKMKPSGVEWIGDVPEGWAVKKIKHIAAIFGRIGFRGYTVNDIVEETQGVITLSPGNIKNDILTLESAAYLSFEKYYESPEIMIFPEDIVLVKTGSTIGKTAIIPQNVPEMTLNPQLVVLKDLKVFPKFLYYQTTCPFFKNMFEVEQTGGTTPTISQEKINSFPVVVPPEIEEQKEVVNFIDHKTSQIDTAISGIRQEIALLQEYRQALIFEAVTGKIDVRENTQN